MLQPVQKMLSTLASMLALGAENPIDTCKPPLTPDDIRPVGVYSQFINTTTTLPGGIIQVQCFGYMAQCSFFHMPLDSACHSLTAD